MRIPLIHRAVASSSRADGPTCRGVSISSAASSPLPRRLLPCAAAAPPSSYASPTAAWCATTAAEEARGAPGCCVLESPGSGRAAAPPVAAGALRRDPSPGRVARVTLAPPWPPRTSTASLFRNWRVAPPWGRRPISLPPAARHRSLPICQSTDAPPHRRHPAAGSFRPECGPRILEGGQVPSHGVREGQPLLSPFDVSLCP